MEAIIEYMTSPCTTCFMYHGKCIATFGEDCPIKADFVEEEKEE